MNKKFYLLLIVPLFYRIIAQSSENSSIMIRLAEARDIPELIRVDRAVTYEYFEPLFLKAFPQYDFGKQPRPYLEEELADNAVMFKELLETKINPQKKILVAQYKNQRIVGFIVVARLNKHEAEIQLLCAEKEFRGKHVGKKLVHHALKVFPNITACNLYTMQTPCNASVQIFYEKIGFKRMGPAPLTCPYTYYGISYRELFYLYRYEFNTH